MSCVVAAQDGLITMDASEPMLSVVIAALAQGVHVGTVEARHATVGDALSSGDALLCHRLMRAEAQAASGWLASPLAPRAAVGPDLACFVVGTRNTVARVTLAVEPAVGWIQQRDMSLTDAVAAARILVSRGCTLVTLTEDVTLTAALPRKGAGHGFTAATTPSPSDARVIQTALVAWEDVEDLWRSLRPVQVHALDSHHATISVMEGSARLPQRHPHFPDDVVAAFSLEARRA